MQHFAQQFGTSSVRRGRIEPQPDTLQWCFAGDNAQTSGVGNGSAASADMLTSSGSAEDGAVYLASVKAAQQELDTAGGTMPCGSSTAPSANWPGPNTSCSKLAAMKAATQAALAAVGLTEATRDSGSGAASASATAATAPLSASTAADSAVVEVQEASAESLQDCKPEVPAHSSDSQGGAAAGEAADPGSFDLGLINSWSSAATDPVSDGDGSSSPNAVSGSPPATAAAPIRGSVSSSSAAATIMPQEGSVVAASDNACPEDVVVDVASAEAPGAPAVDLYELD